MFECNIKSIRRMTAPWFVGVVLVATIAGCASWGSEEDESTEESQLERARHGNLSDAGLEVDRADLNGDDRPDQWRYYDGDRLVRVERDMNFDGDIDMWQHYNEEGELIEEEVALDRAGHVDVVAFYEDGRLRRQMMASGFDGSFPIERFYDNQERLLRVERDSSGDGQVDVWEYYDDGERQRIGWDTSGDGQPDTFDQYD